MLLFLQLWRNAISYNSWGEHEVIILQLFCSHDHVEWMNEWCIIHAFLMLGSMDASSLQTVRTGFVIHPEKVCLSVWMDAWVSNPSANTASVANTWYMLLVRTDSCVRGDNPQLRHVPAAKKIDITSNKKHLTRCRDCRTAKSKETR